MTCFDEWRSVIRRALHGEDVWARELMRASEKGKRCRGFVSTNPPQRRDRQANQTEHVHLAFLLSDTPFSSSRTTLL